MSLWQHRAAVGGEMSNEWVAAAIKEAENGK